MRPGNEVSTALFVCLHHNTMDSPLPGSGIDMDTIREHLRMPHLFEEAGMKTMQKDFTVKCELRGEFATDWR